MSKLDIEAGRNAIKSLQTNASRIDDLTNSANALEGSLAKATEEIQSLLGNAESFEKNTNENITKNFDNLSSAFDTKIQVRLSEGLAEQSTRIKDLNAEIKNFQTSIEKQLNKISEELTSNAEGLNSSSEKVTLLETKLKEQTLTLYFFIAVSSAIFCWLAYRDWSEILILFQSISS